MDLCKYCSEVVSAELPNRIFEEGKGFLGDAVPHYATFAALSDSAKSCPLCAKFLRGFEGSPNIAAYRTPDSVITKFEVRPYNSGYGDRLELLKHNIMAKYLVCRVDDRPLGACSLLVERDNLMVRHDQTYRNPWKMQTPVSLDGVPSRMIWRPSTEGVQTLDGRLDTIRGWFEECQKNHPKCMQNPNLELPTRLIDVGSDSHPIRLVDVKSLGDSSSVVYAALSHCWGSKLDSHFVTTVKNEAVQRDKIDLASLPGTYRDAIMVTRKLGLRYIWVDSLCIIQENIADWEFESSHMGSVFEGAFISLAATDAEDGDGGLFLTSLEAPLQVKYDSGAQPALVRCPAADAEKLHNAPLSSRAWALQEVILSKRTIHFTKDQLFWQCHTLFLSEDGIIQQDKFGSLRFSIVFKTLDFKDTHAALRYWWMWMQDYSARKLTYHQDWLAAIAGITQYFADETGLTPLLGMWRESLLEDLAWYTNVEGSRSEIPNMPSWSWLRHEKRICEPPSQGCARSRAYSEIRKIDIGWTATPLTSPIKYTTLIVWGPIVHLKFRLLESIKSQGGGWVLSDQDIPEFSLFHLDEKVASQSAREVFEAPCLALSTYHRTYSLDKDRQSHGLGIFLALRKVDSKLGETPKYERLGMGQWDATPGKSNPLDGVESSLIELL